MLDNSNCEKMVMSVIYDETEEMALRDLMKKVNQKFNKNWKPQTVSTFLARLVKKDFLSSKRKGRITYYSPVYKLNEYRRKMCMDICKMAFQDDVKKFKAYVAEIDEEKDR